LDPQTHQALYDFYREEIERQIEQVRASGILRGSVQKRVDPVCQRFLDRLDCVCWRSEFPALAKLIIRNFETLTRLGEIDPRSGH
jgi:hypothetical protein